jgi:type II secretory pathway pseudopilin PulG
MKETASSAETSKNHNGLAQALPDGAGDVMDSGVTTVLVAVIAVLGTLLSAVLTQLIGARNNREAREQARVDRHEEREIEEKRLDFVERRTTYTQLNTEMRKYRRELSNYLHLIRAGGATDEALGDLQNVRRSYSEHYADAQMIVSDDVFAAARRVNRGLLDVYGMTRRLDGSGLAGVTEEARADSEETVDSALTYLDHVMQDMNRFRGITRADLGVTSEENV